MCRCLNRPFEVLKANIHYVCTSHGLSLNRPFEVLKVADLMVGMGALASLNRPFEVLKASTSPSVINLLPAGLNRPFEVLKVKQFEGSGSTEASESSL